MTLTHAKVLLSDVDSEINNSLCSPFEDATINCNFCSKLLYLNSFDENYNCLISNNIHYCNFCLRNDFNTKRNKHILIVSLRPIIGYIYHTNYNVSDSRIKLYLTQIMELIENHITIGLKNPIFRYDPETFCWFIDFYKIGDNKINSNEVLKTIIRMISAFNPFETIKDFNSFKLIEKYKEAVKDFLERRYRPINRKILEPTLINCSSDILLSSDVMQGSCLKFNYNTFKEFLPENLRLKHRY